MRPVNQPLKAKNDHGMGRHNHYADITLTLQFLAGWLHQHMNGEL